VGGNLLVVGKARGDSIQCASEFKTLIQNLKTLDSAGFQWFSTGTKKGPEGPYFNRLQNSVELCSAMFGAGNETRTRDPDLGKVVLYQLSYSRVLVMRIL
jgi:hypothetical protein